LDRGRLAACDTPDILKERIGGDVITLTSPHPAQVAQILKEKLNLSVETLDGTVRLERPRGHELVPQLIEAVPGLVDAVSVGKPTLEDVFIQSTGRIFRDEDPTPQKPARRSH
jgi:ABC-2 type transport system ATP-binding protein